MFVYNNVVNKFYTESGSKKRKSNSILFNSIVTYKYTATMTLIKKSYREFINSILEKSDKYAKGKLELHVCPFLEYNGRFIYQPIFDFDKGVTKNEILKFIQYELKPYIHEYFINVEISVHGFHVVCYVGYGLLTKEYVDNMRDFCIDKYKKLYPHLDVITSMRLMPIRRTPSIAKSKDFPGKIFRIYPISLKEFKNKSIEELKSLQNKKTILSIQETEKIIKTKILTNTYFDIYDNDVKLPYFLKEIF